MVTAVREAIDAIYPATTLEALQEDLLEALNNQNPSIKAETASFLARAFSRTSPAAFSKTSIKVFAKSLVALTKLPDAEIRFYAFKALRALWKLLGAEVIEPYLLDIDAQQMAKIKNSSPAAENAGVATSASPPMQAIDKGSEVVRKTSENIEKEKSNQRKLKFVQRKASTHRR